MPFACVMALAKNCTFHFSRYFQQRVRKRFVYRRGGGGCGGGGSGSGSGALTLPPQRPFPSSSSSVLLCFLSVTAEIRNKRSLQAATVCCS